MRSQSWAIGKLAGALSAGVLLWAGPAAAQSAPNAPAAAAEQAAPKPLAEALTGPAKADYDLGKLLYEKGDFATALVKFRRAHELSGDPRLLWNVAVCEVKLHHYARVIAALERLQREGDALLTAEDRRAAVELEQASRALVSKITLTVSEPGAQVFVDDEPVGTTPLAAPLLVDAGVRRLRISKAGYKDHVHAEQIDGGGEVALSVRLERDAREGRLIVTAAPGATIALDGKVVGTGRWEGTVASGGYRLRVTAPGKVPHESEVVVQDNQVRTVQVTLRAAERGGGVPTWLWIAGGAVLAAGAVTAGAFLLAPDPAPPVPGTLGMTEASWRARW